VRNFTAGARGDVRHIPFADLSRARFVTDPVSRLRVVRPAQRISSTPSRHSATTVQGVRARRSQRLSPATRASDGHRQRSLEVPCSVAQALVHLHA
jgi:hypothetical protein